MFLSQSVRKTMQLLLLYFCFSVHHHLAYADPPEKLCPNTTNIAHNSPFQLNLNNLLGSLSSNASVKNYYNTSIGNDTDGVYGLFLCYNYASRDKCENCIANTASENIKRLCSNTSEAVVWEEDCQLRYSNQRFFGHLDVTGNMPRDNKQNVSEPDRFRSAVNDTLQNLTKLAAFDPSTGMYVTGAVNFTDTNTIHALVQCTTDLSPDDCNTCLETAIIDVSSCCYFSRGARVLSRSCYLRYEFYAFYDGETEFPNSTQFDQGAVSSGGWERWMTLVLAIGSTVLVVALLVLCTYCFAVRNGTIKLKSKNSGQEVQLCDTGHPHNTDLRHQKLQGHQEFPFFDLATINVATDDFSDSNKLGQGGFGPVYKGILPDGKEIAVKRLSSSSEQGSDEFTNEVLLILKLQHKNLVKLLGFCVDGEEKLLIYEYMPNSSLDVFIFDPRKRAQLNWSRRLNIINGIAKGMLYLHEDSRLRIIHRDLKASNVLLDVDMNPKISDFGMARIFGGSTDGEANTARIVGTYGYMAPEFAMEGLYSIKSDVFSFGVLLLEIITGRRNAGFHLSKRGPSLLAYAWQLWNEGRGLELMDPLLMDSCCPDEFLRCMHIGLLCVQEDSYERPTMSYVVVMLKSETVTLAPPERPAFSVGRFSDHYEANDNICSVNCLTISDITPR
ncbi:cysteine-rich receptor-like protein kinase 15 isoform X2 [Cornus florida]|uniref:cysteine-rich receptor-like protein kinase 15 isoform X2 n=1 Tax=Cornus florida TaxID=4283 RepID=UPI00289925BF|nr:cysteine-rich receptor-like protein kinase 15 isoform X2 [Cornus florida]